MGRERRLRGLAASLVLASFAGAGCGGGGAAGNGGNGGGAGNGGGGASGNGGNGGGAGPVSLDDFSNEVTLAECRLEVRCREFSDLALCQQVNAAGGIGTSLFTPGALAGFAPPFARADFNGVSAIVVAARAGKARYDGAAARACLDAVEGLACGALPIASVLVADACQGVFTGTLADGDRCISDLECGPHSFCALPPGSTCDGTCTSAGPQCNTDRQCPSGQACDQAGACATPVPPGSSGEPCGTNDRCQADLVCVGKTCVAPPKAGEPCAPGGNPFYVCAFGLACVHSADMTSATCMVPAMKGEACQDRDQCGGRVSSLICDDAQHRCVDWATGGPCHPGTCPYAAYCDGSSICQPARPLGGACDSSDQCGPVGADCQLAASSGTQVCTAVLPPTCDP